MRAPKREAVFCLCLATVKHQARNIRYYENSNTNN